jgi:hypothetical protein
LVCVRKAIATDGWWVMVWLTARRDGGDGGDSHRPEDDALWQPHSVSQVGERFVREPVSQGGRGGWQGRGRGGRGGRFAEWRDLHHNRSGAR